MKPRVVVKETCGVVEERSQRREWGCSLWKIKTINARCSAESLKKKKEEKLTEQRRANAHGDDIGLLFGC